MFQTVCVHRRTRKAIFHRVARAKLVRQLGVFSSSIKVISLSRKDIIFPPKNRLLGED